jgi:two-component system, chemotaxis family, chemotaxis protein CheY
MDDEEPRSGQPIRMESREPMGKVSVLVVDDNEPMRETIASILSGEGNQCESAENGVEALQKCKGKRFDAVVTDLDMPEMDGITLTRELTRCFLDLPVMLMTAHEGESLERVARDAGAREFLRKPFDVSEFLNKFHRMLHASG